MSSSYLIIDITPLGKVQGGLSLQCAGSRRLVLIDQAKTLYHETGTIKYVFPSISVGLLVQIGIFTHEQTRIAALHSCVRCCRHTGARHIRRSGRVNR